MTLSGQDGICALEQGSEGTLIIVGGFLKLNS